MNLSYFEKPIIEKLPTYSFAEESRFDAHLSAKDYNVAIFGIEEGLNSLENSGCKDAPNAIRKHLYALQWNFKNLNVCDLGNVRKGNTVKDRIFAVRDIVAELTEQNVVCIVLGGSHDFTVPVFEGLKERSDKLNVSVIDNKIALGRGDNDFNAQSFLYKILEDKYLHRLESIAYQSYFVPEYQKSYLKEYNQFGVRVGIVRSNIQGIEPLLRDSDLVSFNMSAVRQCDAPAYAYANPHGLYGEEACTLSFYAGWSDRVKVFGMFELNPAFDQNDRSASLAAQTVWHFLEGMNSRAGDYPKRDIKGYHQYVVQSQVFDDNMVFYRSETNGRYWLEIPTGNGEKEVFGCTWQEYEDTKKGKIPETWLKYYKK
jgi:arginase family enzyme